MIKKQDCDLLWHLDFRSRIPIATLAQELKISKAQTHRRLRALSQQGVIRRFSCVLDVSKFGYSAYRFYFRLSGGDPKVEEKICSYFALHDFTLWVVKLLGGRWDIEVVFVARNAAHLNMLYKQAKHDLGDFFVEYNLSTSPLTHHFRRDYLTEQVRRKLVASYVGHEPYALPLDAHDLKILEMLTQDSKQPNQAIARVLGVSYHTVQRRIAQLEKSGVIQCYRPVLDFRQVGRRFLKVLFKLSTVSQRRESELLHFLAGYSFVICLVEVLGDWQLEVECEAEDSRQVFQMVAEARRKFGAFLDTSDIIEVSEEIRHTYMPHGIVKGYLEKPSREGPRPARH